MFDFLKDIVSKPARFLIMVILMLVEKIMLLLNEDDGCSVFVPTVDILIMWITHQVALVNGIAMGGGAALMVPMNFFIVTDIKYKVSIGENVCWKELVLLVFVWITFLAIQIVKVLSKSVLTVLTLDAVYVEMQR